MEKGKKVKRGKMALLQPGKAQHVEKNEDPRRVFFHAGSIKNYYRDDILAPHSLLGGETVI